jgi:hypothetical protein
MLFVRLICAVALLFGALRAEGQEKEPLQQIGAITLPGVEGRIDHMSIDEAGKRLFVAALGNNSIEVVDLKAGKAVRQLKGMEEPQGIAVLPDLGKLVVASGGDGAVRIYDLKSLDLLHIIKNLDDADNVRYDSAAKRVYVGYGKGTLAGIDPSTGQKVTDVKLAGHPESFQLEKEGARIFVNVPTARHVAVVDREKQAVLATWPLKDAAANFPMALDEAHHRVFIGCRAPGRLLVLDTDSGKVLASIECSGDCDDLFYDVKRARIYASCGEGFIDIFEQTDADHYRRTTKTRTAAGARTSFFNFDEGLIYLAVPHRGDQRAELRIYRAR